MSGTPLSYVLAQVSGIRRLVSRRLIPLSILLAAAGLAPLSPAQSVTGSVSGTLLDSAGAVIAGAPVQLVNEISQQARENTTNGAGAFQFTSILPGSYTLKIAKPGFKSYEQKGIIIGAQEKVDLHTITLELGSVSTAIEVQAQTVHVQTDTSDHTIDVNLKQIQDTPIRGRDFQAIIKDLAGVQDLGTHDNRGWGTQTPTVNGGQQGQVLLTLDGIASQDSGAPGLNTYQAPSIDAIGEVKLLVGNYDAEYGSRNGGQLNISIKNGTAQYHGSAYYYWRHEELNANEFFNNLQGIGKPEYRFQNPGGTIGGPLLIPGVPFNKNRNRLFFFFSYDYVHNTASGNSGNGNTNRYTMPTALERQGNFSQSFNTNGTPIIIRNPTTGQPFTGNIIPTSQQSPIGVAMLNQFPLPNAVDPTGQRQFNFLFTPVFQNPREDKILRVDYNISSKDTMFVRLLQDYQNQSGFGAILGPATQEWGQFPHSYHIPSAGVAATYIHTFSPSLVNELTWGINKAHQGNSPTDEAIYNQSLLPLKDANGNALATPNIFPASANTMKLKPNVNFGLPAGFTAQSAPASIPNLPQYGFDSRWPFDGTDSLQNLTENITYVRGPHTFKAGFYYEHDARNVSVYSTFNTAGTYYFGSDLGNPVDSGDPLSNAVLGSLYGYGQDNQKLINRARYKQFEWFLQDTWKVFRRFTVDYGMRFQIMGPLYSSGGTLGIFQQSAYDPSKVGQLIYPSCLAYNASGTCTSKSAVDPRTGASFPYANQGTFDPSTYPAGGVPFSGIAQYHTNFFNYPSVSYNPRIGFAYDVFGNGRTAIRGGFGIFHGRYLSVDNIGAIGVGTGPLAAPPNFQAPIILNTTIPSVATAPLVFTPQNVVGGSPSFAPPSTYDWTFNIQQDLGHGYIVDVAYVGNVAHRQSVLAGTQQLQPGGPSIPINIDFNAVAPYTTWTPTGGANPKYLDPTSNGHGTASFYSTNLIRALAGGYQGLGSIAQYSSNGESNYNALQVQLNKRLGGRLQFGVNYTWSKTLVYTRYQWTPDELNKNIAGANRPQAVNANWTYAIPDGSRFWSNNFTKQALDGWHVAGIGTLYYGQPLTIGCNAVGAPAGYWTGTPTGGIPFRCQQTGSLWLGNGATPASVGSTADPSLWYKFNPAGFTLPPANSLGIGNTPPVLTYGPGVASFDLTVYKDFKISESKVLEIKAEAFNAFNHFSPGAPNTLLNINFASGANTNNLFGTIAPTQSTVSGVVFGGAQVQARHMVLSARFTF
jgi:hypothetical protein